MRVYSFYTSWLPSGYLLESVWIERNIAREKETNKESHLYTHALHMLPCWEIVMNDEPWTWGIYIWRQCWNGKVYFGNIEWVMVFPYWVGKVLDINKKRVA